MNIRNISYKEIEKFSKLGVNELKGNKFKQQLIQWLNEGRTRLEWCFIAEDNYKFYARIFYFKLPNEPLDLKIGGFYIYAETVEKFDEVGEKLINSSLKEVCLNGIKRLEYHNHIKDDIWSKRYGELLIKCGFNIIQEKKSFIYNCGNISGCNKTCSEKDNRLKALETMQNLYFKSLDEIGKEEFVKAIQKVTESTLDEEDLISIRELGAEKAALEYFGILEGIDFNKNWWKVAYVNDNELLGLVVPQKFNDDIGAINYIGVVPEKRGNNFVDYLLMEGTRILKHANIKKVVADIDVKNIPMEQALCRVGYKIDSGMRVLRLDIQ